MNRQPAVYLLTNRPDASLYTGVTSDLPVRGWQHRQKLAGGFTARYNLTRLVYFELYADMYQAIAREKQIKAGSRAAKIRLIERINPQWRDLYPDICRWACVRRLLRRCAPRNDVGWAENEAASLRA